MENNNNGQHHFQVIEPVHSWLLCRWCRLRWLRFRHSVSFQSGELTASVAIGVLEEVVLVAGGGLTRFLVFSRFEEVRNPFELPPDVEKEADPRVRRDLKLRVANGRACLFPERPQDNEGDEERPRGP